VSITSSQLTKDASIVLSFKFILHVHRQANCCSATFFWKFFERILFTLRHLQSFVVAFIEQVQNTEKSKSSVVVVVLYRVSPLWKQGFKRDNQMYKSSQVKSALRKFREGKDHDCDSFMSDVSVLYKSWVSHLVKWTTSFAECKRFD